MRMGRGMLEASSIPITTLLLPISQQLGRRVVDKTGLTGLFDIKLEWTPDPGQGPTFLGGPDGPPPAADLSGPSIFTALEEQLGLRLESARGPVDVLVIESAQKPADN